MTWEALQAELDAWAASGAVATLWWRDDDAVAPTPALDRLLAVARGLPIALAVVPAGAVAALAALPPSVTVVQHGWRHHNHRPAGEKAAEYALDRPVAAMAEELAAGWARLRALGLDPAPMLVPPWNRIDPAVVTALPALGYQALSTFGPAPALPAGLRPLNAHVDPIAWKAGGRFIGTDRALERLVRHLAARRSGAVPRHEATGLLTHHLVHPPGLWSFLDELVQATAAHPAVQWLDMAALLARGDAAGG